MGKLRTAKATRDKPSVAWQNRIVGSGVQRADQFVSHPDNWKIHPGAQEDVLVHVLDRIGWIQEVLVNKRTGYVVDGHLRILAALRKGEDTLVPYKEIDLSESEEALALSVIDPIAALAGTDQAKYDELLGLLPSDFEALATRAKGDVKATKTLVQFTASDTPPTVVVDCKDDDDQARLLQRLASEGYVCRAGR